MAEKKPDIRCCPKCRGKSSVIDTRTTDEGPLRRRRKCKKCKIAWSTMEVPLEGSTGAVGDRKQVRSAKFSDTVLSKAKEHVQEEMRQAWAMLFGPLPREQKTRAPR